MKKFLKVLGIIILIIVVIVAALAIWQWKYIMALYDGIRYDEKSLGEKQVKATEKTVSDVGKYLEASVRELTEEEKQKIASGELSQTELMAQIISEATGVALPEPEPESQPAGPVATQGGNEAQSGQPEPQPSNGNAAQPPENNAAQPNNSNSEPVVQPTSPSTEQVEPSKPEAPKPTSDQLVAESVGQLYSLQAQYTGQIAGLVARAKAYYNQQKKENGVAAARANTLSQFSGELSGMESACDGKVEAVLADLSSNLKAIGADTSIISTLRAAYKNEKAAQRAVYVNKYMK